MSRRREKTMMGRRWRRSADGDGNWYGGESPAKKVRRSSDDAEREEEGEEADDNCSKNVRLIRYRDGTEEDFESRFQAAFVGVVDDGRERDAAACEVPVFPVRP